MQLVLLGDSLLAEAGSDRVAMFEHQLGDGWVVLNCAMSGCTAAQCLRHAAYLARLRPSAVLVSVGTNDASPDRAVEAAAFEHDLGAALRACPDARRLVLLPPGVDDTRRNRDELRTNADIDRFRSAAARAADAAGAETVDGPGIAHAVAASGGDPYLADGIHLSDAMYASLAVELGRRIG
jgi:lysophospholipase L1-like esterase